MKKLFTLIAVAAMALSANAQSISFTETASAGTLNGKSFGTGLVLTVTDTNNKVSIDGNSQYFGTVDDWTKYSFRMKSGGKSDSKLGYTLTVPTDGTLTFHMRSSSSTDARTVNLMNGEIQTASFNVTDDNKTTGTVDNIPDKTVWSSYTTEVNAGTYTITFNGGLNIYGIILSTGSGIEAVKTVKAAQNGATYNVAGQQVDAAAKGLVIKDGKKFVNK